MLGPLFALALAIELCIAMLGAGAEGGLRRKGAPYVLRLRHAARTIGRLFLTKYLFPFEVASMLLLVAAVGAVVLARRRRGLERPTSRASTGGCARSRARPTPGRWPRPPASRRRTSAELAAAASAEPEPAGTGGDRRRPEGGW